MGHSNVPWNWVLLDALRSRHGEADLSDIYEFIESMGPDFLPSRLFEEDLRWGRRPVYQHTVRSILSDLKQRGLVEWVARGRYRLTDTGKARLREYDQEHDGY